MTPENRRAGIIRKAPHKCKARQAKRCFLKQGSPYWAARYVQTDTLPMKDQHPIPDDNFRQRVFTIVAAIPYGKVATYGQVAQLAGAARAARQVGGVLKRLPEGSALPWFRVVNRFGQISLPGPGYQRQRDALQAEGVVFTDHGAIDLDMFGWRP